mmetsp:Transcript_44852/g.141238  ORF Transcript_44852/g.141238 Transcript_44852/m.141238 type:complete len:325 (-) Transcript_44852:470-1444(-)
MKNLVCLQQSCLGQNIVLDVGVPRCSHYRVTNSRSAVTDVKSLHLGEATDRSRRHESSLSSLQQLESSSLVHPALNDGELGLLARMERSKRRSKRSLSRTNLRAAQGADDGRLVLQLLVRLKELSNLPLDVLLNIPKVLNLIPTRIRVNNCEQLLIFALLIRHVKSADHANVAKNSWSERKVGENDNVDWVAIAAKSAWDETVITRIENRAMEHSIKCKETCVLVPFVLVCVSFLHLYVGRADTSRSSLPQAAEFGGELVNVTNRRKRFIFCGILVHRLLVEVDGVLKLLESLFSVSPRADLHPLGLPGFGLQGLVQLEELLDL